MATIVGSINTSHVFAIGGAIAKSGSRSHILEAVLRRFSWRRDWLATSYRMLPWSFNDRGRILPRQDAHVRRRRGAEYRVDEGIPALPPHRGDPRPFPAPDRVASRRGIRTSPARRCRSTTPSRCPWSCCRSRRLPGARAPCRCASYRHQFLLPTPARCSLGWPSGAPSSPGTATRAW